MSFKRELVAELVGRGVSERLACRALGLSRSSYRYKAQHSEQQEQRTKRLRERVVALAHKHRRFGYRRVAALLRREGEKVNHKLVWALWQAEKLSLPRHRPKKHSPALLRAPSAVPRQAERRGHVWTYDFIFDRTERGQQLKMLVVLDEFTRECHKIKVGLQLDSKDVIGVLEELLKQQSAPEYLRSDNGGEFIAAQLELWLKQRGTKTAHIAPGHPWENGYCESFNGKFRDECLNGELFYSVAQAQVVVESWRQWYNEGRPHSSLGYRTPQEVVEETKDYGNMDNSSSCPHSHNPDCYDGDDATSTRKEKSLDADGG